MSEMRDKDSIELFSDSMKKAASGARQIAKTTKSKDWLQVAIGFDNLRAKGEMIYKRAAPSQAERLAMVDLMVEKQSVNEGSDKVN